MAKKFLYIETDGEEAAKELVTADVIDFAGTGLLLDGGSASSVYLDSEVFDGGGA